VRPTFLSDGAVHDRVASRSTDWALIRFEDAEGLAPGELRRSFPAVGARGVVGGFVHLGGSVQWVDFGVGSWLKLALAPVVTSVENSCDLVHEGCLWNLVELPR
jgi:hypothetical protein